MTFTAILYRIQLSFEKQLTRRALQAKTQEELCDIGLSHREAREESRRGGVAGFLRDLIREAK